MALPILAAGANLLPRPKRYGGINPERHWLPLFLYALWVVGTAVHIWSIGHIAERPFEFALVAPVMWVSAWTLWNRLSDCVAEPSTSLQKLTLTLAFLTPLLGGKNPMVLAILCLLNLLAFLMLWILKRHGLAKELALASLLLAFAGMPLGALPLSRNEHVAIALVCYCIVHALRSPNPEAGLVGALAVGVTVAWLARSWSPAVGVQAALVFFLSHSLRWPDNPSRPDRVVRYVAGFLWIIHSVIWTRGGWPEGAVATAGGIVVLSSWVLHFLRQKSRPPLIIPMCSSATALASPANWFVGNCSPGLVALAGSLLLFGLGTALAFTRHRWERQGSELE